MASSWEKALRDVPTDELENCYNRAASEYVDIEKPFGTPQLLRAWQFIIDERRHARARSVKPQSDERCYYCSNTGYQTIKHPLPQKRVCDGEEYTTEPGHTSLRPCACSFAPAGQRSDYPLREPNYEREVAGRWWVRVN